MIHFHKTDSIILDGAFWFQIDCQYKKNRKKKKKKKKKN
jgi:hypothetical protein